MIKAVRGEKQQGLWVDHFSLRPVQEVRWPSHDA
jgi:hypothetical protein